MNAPDLAWQPSLLEAAAEPDVDGSLASLLARAIAEPVVAIVSVGEPRKFLLRPKGGGRSTAFLLGRCDLLVTGGATPRAWEHTVPKVSSAGPRISISFRHGLMARPSSS